jgi:RimJ/RimL family protein N-acetyltransferase
MPASRLDPSHAEMYRALMLEAYELHPDAFTSSVAEREKLPLAWWAGRLDEEPLAKEVVFGAFVGEELCGVAGVSFETREKAKHKATLFGMYVPQRHRQHGLGRELVGLVLDGARSRPGTLIVQLTVTEGNAAAQGLYASCGFSPFGTEPYAVRVGSRYVSKVHMWCSLQAPSAGKPA